MTTTKAEINTTEDARDGLTTDLIKTMRKAKRIVFLAYPSKDDPQTITFLIRLIREKEHTVDGQRVTVEFTHDVTLNGTFDQYTYPRDERKDYRYAAAHLYVYDKGIRNNDDIQTWLSFLRPGDHLIAAFYPDSHMTGYMKDASYAGQPLHCDVFRAVIKRNPKTRTIGYGEYAYEQTDFDTFSFNLAMSICPENSARMCRETQWGA